MQIVKFKFDIGQRVKRGSSQGVVIGNAIFGESATSFKKRCLVRLGVKEKWFFESVLTAADVDVKTCAKRAYQPMAVKIAVKIADNGTLTTTELIEIVKSPRASVSTYLTRLRTEEIVESNPDGRDARVQHHSITTYGREWLDKRYFESQKEEGAPKEDDFFSFKENGEVLESDEKGDKQSQLEF